MPLARSPQGRFTFALLGGALVLSGALAYAAVDATRRHRATAHAVLHDYVTFAAEQFAQRFTQDVEYYGLYPTMQLLGGIEGALPEPESLAEDADRRLKQSLELAQFFFRYDARTAKLDLSASASPPPAFRDVLRSHVDRSLGTSGVHGIVMGDTARPGSIRMFFFMSGAAAESTVVGFETHLPPLRAYAETVLARAQLLPASVTGNHPNDSIIAVSVVRTTGDSLWTLGDPSTPVSSEESARGIIPLADNWPDIELHATLLDPITNDLVAGGVPRARIPLAVTLAFMTAAMLIATVVQIVRERGLAKLRAQFVASVSHELRTPLAQIRMFAETLRLGRIRSREERDRSLAIIDKEARRLTNLVENVLLFSKPPTAAAVIDPVPSRLDGLLREVIEAYRPIAEARAVRLETSLHPVTAPVDEPAMRQAILNLLDNAVKYGPEGQTVHVALTTVGAEARVTVEDQGPGVPSEQRAAIWKRFERLARDRESITTGAGIGLTVVHELLALHGGRAWVEDGAIGARFVLAVPHATTLDAQSTPPPIARDRDKSSSGSRGQR